MAPNLGTIVVYEGFPAIVSVTHDSWTENLASGDYAVPQPGVDQVGIVQFNNIGNNFISVVDVADLSFPSYGIQSV